MVAISEENKSYNQLPSISHTLEKPYMEAGVGIENIFKIIRIDGIWRLSQLDNQEHQQICSFSFHSKLFILDTNFASKLALNNFRIFEFRQGEKLRHSHSYGDIF